MRVAVVGAGIFGITIAVKLARSEVRVDLFEKENDILKSASGINQFRLHRGYHYPRSPDTVRECLESESSFRGEYGLAVIDSGRHYYCIARDDSLISGIEYENFCRSHNLYFKRNKSHFINQYPLDLCLEVNEGRIDPFRLKNLCISKIKLYGINVRLNTRADSRNLRGYDFVVLATYSSVNELAGEMSGTARKLQFEVCEKPVVRLPEVFGETSIVVMDGPFMCIDPMGCSNNYLLGNVKWAIHQANVGYIPEIGSEFTPLLNRDIVKNPPVTNFDKFIASGCEFIPILHQAVHLGSMYTVRAVLPGIDSTDGRPTIVSKLNNQVISVFSGKIGTCVSAAQQVLDIIKPRS